MDDQQLFVISPDGKGEVTLLDTEGGIVVEQGEYSITIPSAAQQVPQAQQQQVVYTSQQAVVQPRVVYSPQPQQVYQVASAHPQQVLFAGGTPIQQQVPIVTQQQQQQVLIQQQQHITQQLIQTQQSQQHQQQIFVSPQGQRIRAQYVATQPQQVQQKPYHLQIQQQQQQHQVQQHMQIQQQQLAAQASAQIAQPPQHPQQQIPVLQAGQQAQASTITFIEEKVTDDKGVVHIMRTPVNMTPNIRRTTNQTVGQQPVTRPSLTPHTLQQGNPVIGGMRAAAPQQPTAGQGPRLQRSTPIHRPPNPVIQTQEQPSYQEAFLKQIENKIPVQKAPTRTKVGKPTAAQQRRFVSQQLGSVPQQQLQSKQQVVGVPTGHTIITNPVGTETPQRQREIHIQNASPSKKLSLMEYRSRQKVSQDLKTQQQQQPKSQALVTQSPSPRAAAGEELRMVPVSVNTGSRQQYCFLQKSDGKKFLCPMEVKVTLEGTPTITSATLTNSKPAQLNTGSNSVLIVKQDGEGSRSSSSPVQSPMPSPMQTSSSVVTSSPSTSPSPSTTVTSGSTPSSTPPIQEQTVHSTAPTEQPDKDPDDKPRFIQGRVALCTNCGILTEDVNRCQRCNFRLPQSVRTISASAPVTSTKNLNAADSQVVGRGISMSTHMGKQEFYGKTGGGLKKGAEKRSTASPAQKPKGRGRGRGKTYEEPEIVSLSSDEDEDKKPSSSGVSGSGSTDGNPQSRIPSHGPPDPISHKEPIITNDMETFEDAAEQECGGAVVGGGLTELQNLPDGSIKGPYASIHCRSVRIGSYKVMPRERVLIVPQGIRLRVPSITDSSTIVTFDIPMPSIVKVLAHFGKSLPVFFLYLKPSVADTIRRTLKMTDKNGYYYDPCSYDEAHKRITILPDRMTDETKMLVKDILNMPGVSSKGKHKLEELDLKEANEILIRSSPTEIQSFVKKPGTQSMETKTLLIYPPPPQKGGISITTDDYSCLEEEQFLNDVIIDFYLKWLIQSKLSEIHRTRTHVFSTFFYKRLTSKPKKGRRPHAIEDDPKLTAAEKRHSRVKSWTKNVDIFEKDFIIIPINEHAHWFLAIICYPGLNGPVRTADGQPVPCSTAEKPVRRRSTRPRNRIEIPIIDDGEWSDRDEAEGDEDELDDDDEDDDTPPPPPSKKTKLEEDASSEDNDQSNADNDPTPPIRQPCILIFDSLSGANRVRIVATLRDYLTVEHRVRKNNEKQFNRDTMKGACPRVPQQMNYSDCGIYTLQFAESFFEHPLKDYTFPIRTLGEWFPQELVRGKREAVAKLIKSLMEVHNPNHESIILPEIMFSSDDRKDIGGSEAHSSCVSSSEGKLLHQSEGEEIPFLERNSGEGNEGEAPDNVKESSEADGGGGSGGSAKSQSDQSDQDLSSKLADDDKCGGHSFLMITSVSEEQMDTNMKSLSSNAIKVTPSTTLHEKVAESFRKALPAVSRITGSSLSTSLQLKNIQLPKGSPTSTMQETQTQVNNVKKLRTFDSDEAIFPVRREKKKVMVKSTNASNFSGLNLLQSNYSDDNLSDGTGEVSPKLSRSVGNAGVKTLTSTTGAMKVERVLFKSEKNGVNEQVISPIKSTKNSSTSFENKTKLINGVAESISSDNPMIQMVRAAAIGGSIENCTDPRSRMQNVANAMSSPVKQVMPGMNNSDFSFQSISRVKSSASTNIRAMSQSTSSASLSQRIMGSSNVPVISTVTSSHGEKDSGVKTVESSGVTSIIDEDTDEILFVMPVASSSNSCQSKPSKKTSLDISDEPPRLMMEEDSRGISSPSVMRSGSSSPTLTGSPAVFRFNERVTSSGRTIAPPKRYLDDDDDIFLKKRRDKPVPGKPRIIR